MKSWRRSVGIVFSAVATQPSVGPAPASKFSMSVRAVEMNCGGSIVLSNVHGGVTCQPEGQHQAERHFNQNMSPTAVLDILSGTIPISPGAPV